MDIDRTGARHSVAALERASVAPSDYSPIAVVRTATPKTARALSFSLATASLALIAGFALAEPASASDANAPVDRSGEASEVAPPVALVPSFVDTQSVRQLEQALFAANANGDVAATVQGGAPPIGATAFGAGLSSFLPDMIRPQDSGDHATDLSLTTADFSKTLRQARVDTGEVRALANEVRQRAEEISERFAGGGLQPGADAVPASAAPAAAAMGPGGPATPPAQNPVGLASQVVSGGVVQGLAQAALQPSGSDAANLLVAPPSALSSDSAVAAAQGVDKPEAGSAPLEGRMALGHRDVAVPDSAAIAPGLDAATAEPGIEIIPSHAPAVAPPPARRSAAPATPAARRLPGMVAPARTRLERRTAALKPETAAKAVKAQAAGRSGPVPFAAAKPVSAKPPILRSSTEAALAAATREAAGRQAGLAPGTPAPAKPSGGLFSSLKPFTIPREIGSQGWDAGN